MDKLKFYNSGGFTALLNTLANNPEVTKFLLENLHNSHWDYNTLENIDSYICLQMLHQLLQKNYYFLGRLTYHNWLINEILKNYCGIYPELNWIDLACGSGKYMKNVIAGHNNIKSIIGVVIFYFKY